MRKTALAAALAAILGGGVLLSGCGAASAQDFVPLEKDLSWPLAGLDNVYTHTRHTARALHYIGPVKQVAEVFTSYSDAGVLDMKDQTVTDFFKDGRVKDQVETDLIGKRPVVHAVYAYEKSGKIKSISRTFDVLNKVVAIEFSYDAGDHLTGVVYKTNGETTKTVTITEFPNGKFKEALERHSSGKADWRLAYQYGDHEVTIDNFYDGGDFMGKGETKSTFKLDDLGRPLSVKAIHHEDITPDDFIGEYRYRYLPNGGKMLHAEEKFPDGPHAGSACTIDAMYFPNGALNEPSVKVETNGVVMVFCPYDGASKFETELDDHGNIRHSREGHEVTELGRQVIRWKYDNRFTITYF